MIWPLIIATLVNIGNAFFDSWRMKKNIRIAHALTALLYGVVCALVALWFGNILYAIPMLFIRPVVFDPLLNVLNKLHPFHVSMTTTSVIDKWERKITKNGFVQWLIWVGLTAVSIWLIQVL